MAEAVTIATPLLAEKELPEAGSGAEGPPWAKSWRVGLFECHKYKRNFAMACFCPCVRFAQTAIRARLDYRGVGYVGWMLLYIGAFGMVCLPFLWVSLCVSPPRSVARRPKHRVDVPTRTSQPWCPNDWPLFESSYGIEVMLPWCGVWYLAFPIMFGIGALKRYEIRRRYRIANTCGIEGCGGCDDFCIHACLEPCAVAQEAVEVDLAELGHVHTTFSFGHVEPLPSMHRS